MKVVSEVALLLSTAGICSFKFITITVVHINGTPVLNYLFGKGDIERLMNSSEIIASGSEVPRTWAYTGWGQVTTLLAKHSFSVSLFQTL